MSTAGWLAVSDGIRHGAKVGVAICCGLVAWQVVSYAQQTVQAGDPLAGLTPSEFEAFRIGLEDFLEVETADEGLGPAYNGTSCAECHSIPAIGGIAPVTTVRAGMRLADGRFEDFDPARGSLFQLFRSPPTDVSRSFLPRRTSSPVAFRSPCSVPDSSRRSLMKRFVPSRIQPIAMVMGSVVVPPLSLTARLGHRGLDDSAGRLKSQRFSTSAGMPIETRWGSRTISFLRS